MSGVRHREGWGTDWVESGLVSTRENGAALHPDLATDAFARIARRAGLPPIRLHDLRHTAASLALQAGVPLKVVSEQLGHSSLAITANTYTSVLPAVARAAAEAVAGVIPRRHELPPARTPRNPFPVRSQTPPEGAQTMPSRTFVQRNVQLRGVGPVGIEPTTRGLKGRKVPCHPVPGTIAESVPTGHSDAAHPAGPVPSAPVRGVARRPGPTCDQPPQPRAPLTSPEALPPEGPNPATERIGERGSLTVDGPFAIVPEWVIDSPVSDTALRLYCVLTRYGNTSGHRMPSRATLATRLRKSTDTIDRALRELEHHGALTVEHRHEGTRKLTNRYHLLALASRDAGPAPLLHRRPERGGGRTSAATSTGDTPRPPAETNAQAPAGTRICATTPARTDAGRVAAPVRHDPEPSTQTPPHPNPSSAPADGDVPADPTTPDDAEARLLEACGITDLRSVIGQLHDHRRKVGRPITPWSRRRVLAALDAAIAQQGWPPDKSVRALLTIAADRHTTSPMRLSAPGPWWNTHPSSDLHSDTPSTRATPEVAAKPDPAVTERGIALARQTLHAQRTGTAQATVNPA